MFSLIFFLLLIAFPGATKKGEALPDKKSFPIYFLYFTSTCKNAERSTSQLSILSFNFESLQSYLLPAI